MRNQGAAKKEMPTETARASWVSNFGKRAVHSFLYRTRLRRPVPPDQPYEPNPAWVRVSGGPLEAGWLLLDTDSPAYWEQEMASGRFDSFIYQALASWKSVEGGTFWDVGAHIGYHSLCFAKLAGRDGRVISFEPNTQNADRFRQHLDRNPELASRIELLSTALSNQDGQATFKFSPVVDDGTSTGSHLGNAAVPGEAFEYASFIETTVTTARADTLLRVENLPPPTVMKIDVEGAEQFVLEGASELLSKVRPLLFVEVHNITQMFHVQRILLGAQYITELLDAEHASTSRCFIVARPQSL